MIPASALSKRLLLTADCHVHPYRIGSRNGGRDRLEDGLNAVRQTLQYARDRRATWCCLGDVKMPKTSWPLDALNGWIELLSEYGDILKILLPGNHDGIGPYGCGLEAFDFIENTRIVPSAVCEEVIPGVQTLVFPHGTTPERRAEFLEHLDELGAQIILGHAFLHEAMVGPMEIQLAAIPPASFGADNQIPVFLGDVHKAQWRHEVKGKRVWSPITNVVNVHRGPWNGEVFYPGSPFQQSWGERNEWPKGCLLVDLNAKSVDMLKIDSPRFIEEIFLQVSDFERWDEQVGFCEDQFVKFIVGPWAESKTKWFEEWREREKPRTFQLIVQRVQEVKERAPVHAGLSSEELLKGYMSWRSPQITGASKKVIFEAGRRLMNG